MEQFEFEQWGFAAGGPLRITADDATAPMVHVGWTDGGMYVTTTEARRLAKALRAAAEAADANDDERRTP
jgi:hypothetical protein